MDDYFRRRFWEMGVNGVQLTSDTLTVGWVAPDFEAVAAAIALCQLGQVRDGVQPPELARSRQPDSSDLFLNLGIGLNELAEGQRAVAVLEHLIDLEPGHVRGLVALLVALGRLGEDDAALDRFTRAVVLAPIDPWTQSNLGGRKLRVGRPAEARPHLEAAVQLAPEEPRGWLLLGESCLECGDEAATRAALGRAWALDPHGVVRDRAEAPLNRLAIGRFPHNPEGINPEALAAMTWALGHLRSLPSADARNLTLKAALLGQHGLRLIESAKAHRLEGLPEPLTALQVACLIHAGLKWPPRARRAGFRWNDSTKWRPPPEGDGICPIPRRHSAAVSEVFTAWMQGHDSEDALRHALTDSGEMGRWGAVTLGAKDRERLDDALNAVASLLNIVLPGCPIHEITRAIGLLRRVLVVLRTALSDK